MSEDTPGVELWKEQTTAFDRVRSVAGTVDQPRPVSYLADEACVSENRAQAHLELLADIGVLRETDLEGTTMYSPDPEYTRAQTLRDLLNAHDHNDLVRLKEELQGKVENWCDKYDVESPDELREHAAKTDSELRTTASNWELVEYRLSLIEDALRES